MPTLIWRCGRVRRGPAPRCGVLRCVVPQESAHSRRNWENKKMAAPKRGARAPKFVLNPSVTLIESDAGSILKKRDVSNDAREMTVALLKD